MTYVPPHRRGRGGERPSLRLEPGQKGEFNSVDIEARLLCDAFSYVYCINLQHRQDRWEKFFSRLQQTLGNRGAAFLQKVKRFDAVDGREIMSESESTVEDMPCLEWNATKNSRYDRHIVPPMTKQMSPGEVGCALSHIRLWRKLAESDDPRATMLILEDDAVFYHCKSRYPSTLQSGRGWGNNKDRRGNHSWDKKNFYNLFSRLWEALPSDWGFIYLGFSDRGERKDIVRTLAPEVAIFRPTYGFHTHAYGLTRSAALTLLENLPVTGPIDVWLADNEWFALNAYCALVANEGWNRAGVCLVTQRKREDDSDIDQSGRFQSYVSDAGCH